MDSARYALYYLALLIAAIALGGGVLLLTYSWLGGWALLPAVVATLVPCYLGGKALYENAEKRQGPLK